MYCGLPPINPPGDMMKKPKGFQLFEYCGAEIPLITPNKQCSPMLNPIILRKDNCVGLGLANPTHLTLLQSFPTPLPGTLKVELSRHRRRRKPNNC
jgi:hypothetical protein